MEFLSIKLDAKDDNASEQFYQLYLKEKDKNKHLAEEL